MVLLGTVLQRVQRDFQEKRPHGTHKAGTANSNNCRARYVPLISEGAFKDEATTYIQPSVVR